MVNIKCVGKTGSRIATLGKSATQIISLAI